MGHQDIDTTTEGHPGDPSVLLEELSEGFRATAEEVVPWFLEQMPLMYFQDTDHVTQLSHLRAIIAERASGLPITLTLRSEDGSQWTSMRPLDEPGVLAELVSELPHDQPLLAAKIHTANDGRLVLDTFEFGQEPSPYDHHDPAQAEKLRQTIAYAREHEQIWNEREIRDFFDRMSADYVLTLTPLRMCRHWQLYQRVTGTDGTALTLEPEYDTSLRRIVVAVGNATRRSMLERIARRLSHSSINIHRAYLDTIDDGDNGFISVLAFIVQAPEGRPIEPESALWHEIRKDLLRIKWLDGRTLALGYGHPEFGLTRAEVITALAALVHQRLVKDNPFAFAPDRIERLTEDTLPLASGIADLFLERFDPDAPLDENAFHRRSDELRTRIEGEVDLEDARTVLHGFLNAVRAILRTNFWVEGRYALSLRIDPSLLTTEDRPEMPYGVFFVHGRCFNAFHVRFRDIARGGVRAVPTSSAEQHAREGERLYDEAYGLAHAQQLKNKDIPEGGAKATILIDPEGRITRSVKAFVDALLDLITPDEATRSRIVDTNGQDELLYLGPDEHITSDLIDWIVDRAQRRGYPTPTALMSSKPGAGISHREYGVTSEGVAVFLEVALRSVDIDPATQPFTLKMTGGPDGDVGGNCLRILFREHGDRVRVVGIADGSGCGEDLGGLDHEELLRLVESSSPIASFNRDRLGPGGRITAIDEPEGVHLRNTLHTRLVADAFVPCGGRPNTLHGGNWRDYLDAEGAPSSRVIVEGANLFLTKEARRELSELGVLIFRDSSANKCGVITSSYEIIACMLLDEAAFLQIKETFVQQVLEKLRRLARAEAEVLARLHRHRPQVPMPEMSTRLSRVMIRVADAIEAALEDLDEDDTTLVRQLVVDHLPAVLVDAVGDRLWTETPRPYLKWIMAKSLSARIVYREGFEYLEAMPATAIARLALRYLRMELERRRLVEVVDDSDLEDRDRIATLLLDAGILSTMGDRPDDEP